MTCCNDYEVMTIGFDLSRTPRSKKREEHPVSRRIRRSNSVKQSRVLIVEDEVLVAENLKEFLEGEGFSVAGKVSTGEEAIQKIFSTPVDLILMDIRLAGDLDGIQTAALIHGSIKQIPVVFITAFPGDLLTQISNIFPSLYRYVVKPFSHEDLAVAIETLLGKMNA